MQYPPHHPKSDSFIDFILPKVLYGFLSLLVGVGVMVLRHPYLARLDQVDWLNGRFEVGLSYNFSVHLIYSSPLSSSR